MNFWEAIKALEEGKKIRKSYWEEDNYIYIDSDNNLRDNYGGLPNLYYIPDDDDDWIIYEEKKEIMKLFIATRVDKVDWYECMEQIIIAHSTDEAMELARNEFGVWSLHEVDMTIPQVVTQRISK